MSMVNEILIDGLERDLKEQENNVRRAEQSVRVANTQLMLATWLRDRTRKRLEELKEKTLEL